MDEQEAKSWRAYNELLIYGGVDRLNKILARYELYKMVIELPGDIVEGGVFKGAGLFYWAKLIEIFNPRTSRKVVGFDTFNGYPNLEDRREIDAAKEFEAAAQYQPVSIEELTQRAASQNLQTRMELIQGDVTSTIQAYVKKNPGFRIALLNLDFDTYDATKSALEFLYDLVVPNGVIVLDEYAVSDWGESKAVDELLQRHGNRLRSIPWTHSPSAYIVKD